MECKLQKEIASFQNLWYGGFKTGFSIKRNQKGIMQWLFDNVKSGEAMLEIGCGGGQWSKLFSFMNRFDKIYCIDVLSAKHNRFWEYVGKNDKINYTCVEDFSLSHIPDNSLDFVYSYDVFCHISKTGQNEYLKNLKNKCKKDAKLFIMYADADKFFKSEPEGIQVQQNEQKFYGDNKDLIEILKNESDGEPFPPGRWYWIGIDGFLKLLENNGYAVLEKDLNIDKTNPITFFTV